MKKIYLAVLLLLIPVTVSALPAFLGAEGFGANSTGGRGGTVYIVDTLSDDTADGVTLRDACEASGPRYVVFAVSGVIMLESTLTIDDPYITIAGQTSPGGVLVAGYQMLVNTHDVIIRHMRFRVGTDKVVYQRDAQDDIIYYDTRQGEGLTTPGACAGNVTTESLGYPCAITGGADPDTLDGFNIWGNTIPGGGNDAYNIIVDHCSFSWGSDENFGVSYNAHDITISWSIFAEGLENSGHEDGNHSKNLLISGKFGGADNVSVHHNFFANAHDRNPRAGGPDGGFTEIVNNVTYNHPKGGGVVIGDESSVNIVHNYVKRGPLTNQSTNIADFNYWDGPASSNNLIYMEGNISPNRPTQSGDDWIIADGGSFSNLLTTDYQRLTPWSASSLPVTVTTASSTMADNILSGVGATKPVRDSIDARNVASYNDGTDVSTRNIVYPDDYPTFSTPTAPTDSDNDGMADSWETSEFGDLTRTATGDEDADGYENIEEYFHHLAGTSGATPGNGSAASLSGSAAASLGGGSAASIQ